MDTTVEDNLPEMAEFQARLARRQVKGCYSLATLGSRTECGGEVVSASTTMNSCGHRIACVGDVVRYLDGRETTITSGAGAALSFRGQPMALIGSFTANGDMIIGSLHNSAQIREFAYARIPGLFLTDYVALCGAADIVSGTA